MPVCSREDSLDVEIAASGFTKEMDDSLIEACIVGFYLVIMFGSNRAIERNLAVYSGVVMHKTLFRRYFCTCYLFLDMREHHKAIDRNCVHVHVVYTFSPHSMVVPEPGRSTLNVLNYKYKYFPSRKYLSTNTLLFGEMYLSTFRVLSKCT